jgi:hypothetical protein
MPQLLNNLSEIWNNAGTTFTGIKYSATDTASAAGSLLMDLQVGGVSRFSFDKNGTLTFGAIPNPVIKFANNSLIAVGAFSTVQIGGGRVTLAADGQFSWSQANNNPNSTIDLELRRDGAAGILAQRRTTTAGPVTYPQTFRIYNEYTDTLNYERGKIEWASNVLRIGTEKLGSGTARALEFQTDGTTRLTIASNGTTTLASTTVFSSNMAFGTTTGTKIGTATNQKIGFWNVTPIEQPTTGIAEAAFVANAGGTTVTDDSTFDGYTLQQVVKALRDTGLLA